MMHRMLLLLVLAIVALSCNAFAPLPSFGVSTKFATSSTELEACRVNAKKEKIKRNRENMRKFKTVGKRGTSRRKTLKKIQASKARQSEAEFIAKCFITVPAPGADQKERK